MRHSLILPSFAVVILLFQLPALSAGQVLIGEPVARLAPTDASLHEWCGAGQFDACTLFVGFRLVVDCAPDGSAVRMSASPRVTPWILFRNLARAAHEQEHIRDVQRSLVKYVDELERAQFASVNDCRAAALTATTSFGDTLRSFARQSTERMHEPVR